MYLFGLVNSAIASPAERKAYVENPAVESATATRSVSIHLAVTVARKGSGTRTTQRRESLVGDARNASNNKPKGAWKDLVLPLTFCDVGSRCGKTGYACVRCGLSSFAW